MTTEEFSEAVGQVLEQEWRKAQFWARIKCFTWGVLAGSAAWVIALRFL